MPCGTTIIRSPSNSICLPCGNSTANRSSNGMTSDLVRCDMWIIRHRYCQLVEPCCQLLEHRRVLANDHERARHRAVHSLQLSCLTKGGLLALGLCFDSEEPASIAPQHVEGGASVPSRHRPVCVHTFGVFAEQFPQLSLDRGLWCSHHPR